MKEHISHRLRTPLTVIKTMLQYADRRWPDLTDEQKKEFVTQTLAQVEELESAVELAESAGDDLEEGDLVALPQQQQA